MACNKWESEGLLMTSEELSANERDLYVQHIESCQICHEEYQSYTYMKKHLFSSEFLLDDAPESLVFTPQETPRKLLFFMPIFMQLFQKVLPLIVLGIGVFVGMQMLAPKQNKTASATPVLQNTKADSATNSKDSLREFREGRSDEIRSVGVDE